MRLANTADVDHIAAAQAISELHRRGAVLHIAPQNIVKFRNVATRYKAANGLGLSCAETLSKSDGFEAVFSLLAETPDIHPA